MNSDINIRHGYEKNPSSLTGTDPNLTADQVDTIQQGLNFASFNSNKPELLPLYHIVKYKKTQLLQNKLTSI